MIRFVLLAAAVLSINSAAYAMCDLDAVEKDLTNRLMTSKTATEKDAAKIQEAMLNVGRLIQEKKTDEACAAADKIKGMIPN